MKRQGSRQTTLEAYFGKRLRVAAAEDDQPDEVVVVSTGKAALEMIADAYASDDEEHAEEQTVFNADPSDVGHDHDYFGTGVRTDAVANPEHVEHDHSYCNRPTQAGGAFGFDSSDDEPIADSNDSDTSLEEEEEIAPNNANDVDAVEELELEHLYEVVDHRVKSEEDDERVDQPVELLRHVLQRFIDDALENSREHGYSTDWMGLSFITERMKKGSGGKGEWLVPFNPPNENNADKILQEMEKFDQSENSPELFGNRITMNVTTIKRPVGGAMDRLIRKKQIRRTPKDPAIIEINNRDNLCLFRAIAVHMFYHETGEGMWKQAQRYSSKGEADRAASNLRVRSGVNRKSAYGVKDAEKVFEYLQQKHTDEYRILIFSDRSKTETVYNSGNNAKYTICLYHHNGHYDVIKTPEKFFGAKHYCGDCEKTYTSIAFHRDCVLRCAQCFRSGPGFPCTGEWKDEHECRDCRKFFANQECMDAHKPFSCNTFHRCPFCEVHYTFEAGKKNGGHKCGEKYCRKCCKKHTRDVGCFIRPLQAKKPTTHRIVVYDVESIIQKSQQLQPSRDEEETAGEASTEDQVQATAPFLVDDDGNDIAMEESGEEADEAPRGRNPFVSTEADEENDEADETRSQVSSEEEFGVSDDRNRTDHEVNYIAAIVMCSECIDQWTGADYENQKCEICGPQKVFKCGEWELPEGRDVVDEFLNFLLHELPSGYPTYAYAHNGGRYDGAFMLQKLQARPKLRPTVTSAGHKYFQISVRQSKHNNAVSFRDSCFLFPMKLEDAPGAYDLPVKPKGDFPYLYNMRENYGKPIDEELNAFLMRHEEEDKKRREEGTPFVLEDVLDEYCFNDVEILAHAVLEFREIFNAQAGCDLFVECTTITSGCIRLWRRKYLKDNTVAIVPNHGYGQHDRQSAVALKYLKWFEWAHGVNMQYSNGDFGEKEVHTKIGRKKLDGYIEPKAWDSPGFKRCNVAACPYCEKLPEEQVAIEFNGCAYHGCPFKCFPNDTKLPTGKMSSEQLEISQNRIDAIKREGYNVIEVTSSQETDSTADASVRCASTISPDRTRR
ncbi:hypothetical protein AAVH_22300 [Aphelenchoides avenae]|nr:hypothetical protein AAVH_22300 [Aphelenchus avenae]